MNQEVYTNTSDDENMNQDADDAIESLSVCVNRMNESTHKRQLSRESALSSLVASFILPSRKRDRLYRLLMLSAIIIIVAYMVNIAFNALGVHIFVTQRSITIDLIHVKDICTRSIIPIRTISKIHTPTFINLLFHDIFLNITVPSISPTLPIISTHIDHVFFLQDSLPCLVDHEFDLLIDPATCNFPNIFDQNIAYNASIQLSIDMRNIWLPLTWKIKYDFPEQDLASMGQNNIPFIFHEFVIKSDTLSNVPYIIANVCLDYKNTMDFLKISLPNIYGLVELVQVVNNTNDIIFYYQVDNFSINHLDPVKMSLSAIFYENCTSSILQMIQNMMRSQPFQWKVLLEPPSTIFHSQCFLSQWFRSIGGYPIWFNFTPGNNTQTIDSLSVSSSPILMELLPEKILSENTMNYILPNLSMNINLPSHMISRMIPDGISAFLGPTFTILVGSTIDIVIEIFHVSDSIDYTSNIVNISNATYSISNSTSLVYELDISQINCISLYKVKISISEDANIPGELIISSPDSPFFIKLDATSLSHSFDDMVKVLSSISDGQIIISGSNNGHNNMIDALISKFAIIMSFKETNPNLINPYILDIERIGILIANTSHIESSGIVSWTPRDIQYHSAIMFTHSVISIDIIDPGSTNSLFTFMLGHSKIYLNPIALNSTQFHLIMDVDQLINKIDDLSSLIIRLSISTDDISLQHKIFGSIIQITMQQLLDILKAFGDNSSSLSSFFCIEIYNINNSCIDIHIHLDQNLQTIYRFHDIIEIPECSIIAQSDQNVDIFEIIIPSVNISIVKETMSISFNSSNINGLHNALPLYIKPNWTALFSVISNFSEIVWKPSKNNLFSTLVSKLLNKAMHGVENPNLFIDANCDINFSPIVNNSISFTIKPSWNIRGLSHPSIKWNIPIIISIIYTMFNIQIFIKNGQLNHDSLNTLEISVDISLCNSNNSGHSEFQISLESGNYIPITWETELFNSSEPSVPPFILTLNSIEDIPCFIPFICPNGLYQVSKTEYLHTLWTLDLVHPNNISSTIGSIKTTLTGSFFDFNPYVNISGIKAIELSIVPYSKPLVIPNINGSSPIFEIHADISQNFIEVYSHYMAYTVLDLYLGLFGTQEIKKVWRDLFGYIDKNWIHYDMLSSIPYDTILVFPSHGSFNIQNSNVSGKPVFDFKPKSYNLSSEIAQKNFEFVTKYDLEIDGPSWLGLSFYSSKVDVDTILNIELLENNFGLINITFVSDGLNRGIFMFGKPAAGALKVSATIPDENIMESRFYDLASRWVLTQGVNLDVAFHLPQSIARMDGIALPYYPLEPEFAKYCGEGVNINICINNTFAFPVAMYLFSVIVYFRNPAWDFPIRMNTNDDSLRLNIHDDSSTARMTNTRTCNQRNCPEAIIAPCRSLDSGIIVDCPSKHVSVLDSYFRNLRTNLTNDLSFANRSFNFLCPGDTEIIGGIADISGPNILSLIDIGTCKHVKGRIIMDIPSCYLYQTGEDLCSSNNGTYQNMCNISDENAMHNRTKNAFLFYANFNKTLDDGTHADTCKLELDCVPNTTFVNNGSDNEFPISDMVPLRIDIPLIIEFEMSLFGEWGTFSPNVCGGLWIGSNNTNKTIVFEWRFDPNIGHVKCNFETFILETDTMNMTVANHILSARGTIPMTYNPIPYDYFVFDTNEESKKVSISLNFTRMDRGKLVISMNHPIAKTNIHEIYYQMDLVDLFKDIAFAATFVSRKSDGFKISAPRVAVTIPNLNSKHYPHVLMKLDSTSNSIHNVFQRLEYAFAIFDTCGNPLRYVQRTFKWKIFAKLYINDSESIDLSIVDKKEDLFFVYFSFEPKKPGLYQIMADISVSIPSANNSSNFSIRNFYIEHGYERNGLNSYRTTGSHSSPTAKDNIDPYDQLNDFVDSMKNMFDRVTSLFKTEYNSSPNSIKYPFDMNCDGDIIVTDIYVDRLNVGFIQVI